MDTRRRRHRALRALLGGCAGDAADRGGMEAVQIWACVLSHKLAFPGAVHMNRGNHEDHHYSLHYGAKGFYGELDRRYTADEAKALKAAFKDLCDCLPLMTVVDEAMLVVHGGLPRFRQSSANAASLDEIEQIRRPLQVQTHAENRQDQRTNKLSNERKPQESFPKPAL